MYLRTGVDLIEIERFEKAFSRHGERLLSRLFTDQEIEDSRRKLESLAARFAAKEAVSKALGTGIGEVDWHEIEICREKSGEPVIQLHGKAKLMAKKLGLDIWSISLSHTRDLAIALVVASGPTSR